MKYSIDSIKSDYFNIFLFIHYSWADASTNLPHISAGFDQGL